MPKIVIEAGGQGTVIRAMMTHKKNDEVQKHGLNALRHLLGCQYCAAYKSLVVDAGFIQVIIDAMDRYSADVGVQRMGCKSLRSLANRHEDYRDRIIKCGLVAVFEANRVHKDHKGVTSAEPTAAWCET